MSRVLGIGGVFFKASDPGKTRQWYADVLGLVFEEWGGIVFTPATAAAHPGAGTVFCPFSADTDYFAPSSEPFMVNLMVDDLPAILEHCAKQGVEPIRIMLGEANGDFAHIMDCDGRKLELWQPKPMA